MKRNKILAIALVAELDVPLHAVADTANVDIWQVELP
jgi:hypothetical protein